MTTPEKEQFPWYRLALSNEKAQQGDILMNFPVVNLDLAAYRALIAQQQYDGLTVQSFNVIILTQSCDLEDAQEDDLIIICPIFSWSEVVRGLQSKEKINSRWSNLRKGTKIGEHLLDKCEIEGYELEHQVIDLRRIYTVPYEVIDEFVKNQPFRVRLMPPYREHMSQAFANVFMRIGLPSNVDRNPPPIIDGTG